MAVLIVFRVRHRERKQELAEHRNRFAQMVNLAHAAWLAAQIRKPPVIALEGKQE
jgi:hypothetical protein